MRAYTVKDGVIANIATFEDGAKLPDGWQEAKNGEQVGWLDNQNGSFSAPVKEAVPVTEQDYADAVQLYLDSQARSMGYDSIFTAVTYAEEPGVVKFQQEGQSLRAWRSLVWEYVYAVLAEVESGARAQPSIGELVAELPVYN